VFIVLGSVFILVASVEIFRREIIEGSWWLKIKVVVGEVCAILRRWLITLIVARLRIILSTNCKAMICGLDMYTSPGLFSNGR
jgi:hypothetical protein